LGDQSFLSPNAVFDQSLLAIRPAISFFAEGAADGCFALMAVLLRCHPTPFW
jgi:hypothetical protein